MTVAVDWDVKLKPIEKKNEMTVHICIPFGKTFTDIPIYMTDLQPTYENKV